MTPADIIQKYIALRDKVEAETKAFQERMQPYDAGMAVLEGAMQEHLNTNNLDNVKSEHGTAFKKAGARVRLADRNALLSMVEQQALEHDDIHLAVQAAVQGTAAFFTNSILKEKITEYVTEHGCAPAGVDVTYITTVQFNRPRS